MDKNVPIKHEGREVSTQGPASFPLVLQRIIEQAKADPQQLRNLVYELARIKLGRETWSRHSRLTGDEAMRNIMALEEAIEEVERERGHQDRIAASTELVPVEPVTPASHEVEIIDPPDRDRRYDPISVGPGMAWTPAQPERTSRVRSIASGMLQLAGIAAFGAVIYAVMLAQRTPPQPAVANQTAKPKEDRLPVPDAPPQARPDAKPAAPAMPLPRTYGVYALQDGQLQELEALPGRAPDERITIGPLITLPSRTMLSDGKVSFIVFRPDLAARTPDRVPVRPVARIARSLNYVAGKAVTTEDKDIWTIRGKTQDFRVGPIGDNNQMILIKPESEDFNLSPGRYALVVANTAYDFTIAGAPTDPAQCLERAQLQNGVFYTECKTP